MPYQTYQIFLDIYNKSSKSKKGTIYNPEPPNNIKNNTVEKEIDTKKNIITDQIWDIYKQLR